MTKEGGAGTVECHFNLEKFLAANGSPIETDAAKSLITTLQTANKDAVTKGLYYISKEQMASISALSATKIRFNSRCRDYYGQDKIISRDVDISTTGTEVRIKDNIKLLKYDPTKDMSLLLHFYFNT